MEAFVLEEEGVSQADEGQTARDAPGVRREALDHIHVLLDQCAGPIPASRVFRRIPCAIVDFERL